MKCSKCGKADCWNHPICDALDKLDISADFAAKPANLSIDQLPQCQSCFGLLRPDIGSGVKSSISGTWSIILSVLRKPTHSLLG